MALLKESGRSKGRNRKAQKGQGKPKVAYGGSKLHYGHSTGRCRCGGMMYATQRGEHECNKCGCVNVNVWKADPPMTVGKKHGTEGEMTMNPVKKAVYRPKTFLEKDCIDILSELKVKNEDAVNRFFVEKAGFHSVSEIAEQTGVSVNDALGVVVRMEQDAKLKVSGVTYGRLG